MPSPNEVLMCKKKFRYSSDAAAKAAIKKSTLSSGLRSPDEYINAQFAVVGISPQAQNDNEVIAFGQ